MAVENGESKNEKNNTRCMTLLDAAKLIEGQERGIDRERERGAQVRGHLQLDNGMKPKAEHILTVETGEKKN